MACFWRIGSFSGADRAQEKQFFTDRLLCIYIPWRNEMKVRERANPLEEMKDEELQKRYWFSRANIIFILSLIKKSICPSTNRSNPISGELQVNPQNTLLFSSNVQRKIPSSRYIEANEPIGSKLLFLSPIRSRKGAYQLKQA